MKINPQKLYGNWTEGWALDLHTVSSIPIEFGLFDTKRTPIGEELYLLKYKKERFRAKKIAEVASDFLKTKNWDIDLLIPVPPSNTERSFQPVYEIAKFIGQFLGLPINFNILRKIKSTSQLKSIEDLETRRKILKDAFHIDFNVLKGKSVLILDDLYRSGATLNAVCDVVINVGKARKVYVLTITKTRSKK